MPSATIDPVDAIAFIESTIDKGHWIVAIDGNGLSFGPEIVLSIVGGTLTMRQDGVLYASVDNVGEFAPRLASAEGLAILETYAGETAERDRTVIHDAVRFVRAT